MAGRRRTQRGFTIVEVLLVIVMMAIFAAAVSPLVHHRVRRQKEIELERQLATMRAAIDRYHEYASQGLIEPWDLDWRMYPESLESLADGIEVTLAQGEEPVTIYFLREIPVDPLTGEAEWSCRGYDDDPEERASSCDDVYDVFSTSPGVALDGSYYADW